MGSPEDRFAVPGRLHRGMPPTESRVPPQRTTFPNPAIPPPEPRRCRKERGRRPGLRFWTGFSLPMADGSFLTPSRLSRGVSTVGAVDRRLRLRFGRGSFPILRRPTTAPVNPVGFLIHKSPLGISAVSGNVSPHIFRGTDDPDSLHAFQ